MRDTGSHEATGLPPYMYPQPEIGQGGGRNAASGLQTSLIDGRTWAVNPMMGNELQLVYLIEPPGLPSGLSGLSMEMYGTPGRWREIYDVPQNKALQGPDPNTGLHVGDTILIPGIAPASGPGDIQPTPGNPPGDPGSPPSREIIYDDRPGGNGTTLVRRETTTTTTKETEKGWWTPGRAAVAAGVVVGGVVLGTWLLTSPKTKKRRRRRRRGGRRRRR